MCRTQFCTTEFLLGIFRKREGVQKSMSHKVPCKIGVLISRPLTSRPLIFPRREAVSSLCKFATTHLTASILNLYLQLTSRPMKWRTLSQRPIFCNYLTLVHLLELLFELSRLVAVVVHKSWMPVATKKESLVLQTNEFVDFHIAELQCLKVVVRVAVDHEVAVPESQARNPA